MKRRNIIDPAAAIARLAMAGLVLTWSSSQIAAEDPISLHDEEIRQSVSRSTLLLEKAAAGTAEKRVCFTCHGQALPVLALVEAQRHGFAVDQENLQRQVRHTHAHLKRGKKSYAEGKGQGGGGDTAGYALWTLADGGHEADDVTGAVTEYLLQNQTPDGFWKCSSDRPPSETSDFTTTYLALRGLSTFPNDLEAERVAAAVAQASVWLLEAEPRDTEDFVFGLLSAEYADVAPEYRDSLVENLMTSQRGDGGWAQKPDMESDPYATGTVLYALHRSGQSRDDGCWVRGIRYLLDSQQEDGSWHVKTRSKPFQKYFETGFPHGADQFISTTATAWATIALLFTLPESAKDAAISETIETSGP
ncbi:terpene cyclase/mutase family protein [Stieleria sp. ICT_E10.1]|uniref:prenyltransferase/squalene oxidase repeat-containing protein n=1 Tax=Stieleria sedimenti TaxID=2976331 RepID=UPI00217FBFE8|nr:terpene cyclase/mutase family protein [Stieleria sedimenti]MCS7469978.1 terpene cyclase/mutase family protein [Stieleria sedimenti]